MSEGEQGLRIESASSEEVVEALRSTRPFAAVGVEELRTALADGPSVERVFAPAGAVLVRPEEDRRYYWLVLDGETRAERPEEDGSLTLAGSAHSGDGFGEVTILFAKNRSPFLVSAVRGSTLIRIDEAGCGS
jgi:CRP-like cAMP-binding protein